MKKPSLVAVDVESTGLSFFRGQLYSVALAWQSEDLGMRSASWRIDRIPSKARELLADPSVAKVGHRIRFDMKWLISNGMPVNGRTHCTKIMQHLLNENEPNGLKDLTRKYFGAEALSDEAAMKELLAELKLKHVGELCALELKEPDPAIAAVILRYNREDAENTLKLYALLAKRLGGFDRRIKDVTGAAKGPVDYYFKESLPSERVLLDIELGGIALDADELIAYGAELEGKQEELLTQLNTSAETEVEAVRSILWEAEKSKKKTNKGKLMTPKPDFKWTSGQHLGMLLYRQLGVPARLTATKKYETAEAVLKQIMESAEKGSKVATILEHYAAFKKLQKEQNTYVGDSDSGLLSHKAGDGRVYAEYHPFIDTGRLGSANPNMQNLPRGSRCKAAFKPNPSCVFIYADYSQVELRIAAHLSGDPAMVEAFNEGLDLHRMTAAALFGVDERDVTPEQRQKGKTCNFLLIYDGGPRRLQEEMPEFSLEQCKLFKDRFFARYPVYKKFLADVLEQGRRRLLLVSEAGRTRRLPDLALGDHINWRRREFTGPEELRQRLIGYLTKRNEVVNEESIFDAAGRSFSHAKKQAFNFPVQSLGASITKCALVELQRQGYQVVTTVHDSIVVQAPISDAGRASSEVKRILESAYRLSVPLKVDMKLLSSLSEDDKVVLPSLGSAAGGKKDAA